MNENEFLRQQQAAVERMREMNARSAYHTNNSHKMPPVPPFVKVPENNRQNGYVQKSSSEQNYSQQYNTQNIVPPRHQNRTSASQSSEPKPKQQDGGRMVSTQPFSGGLNIPFLDSLTKDGDTTLIIGLLLILMSENCDKILLFALVYILL